MNKYLASVVLVVMVFMFIARPVTVFLALAGSSGALEFERTLVHVLDPRTGVIPVPWQDCAGNAGTRRKDHCFGHIHRDFDDDLLQATTTRWLARSLSCLRIRRA